MPGLHLRLYQFERLLEDLEPALYCHLKRRGISPHLYATQWFLTLFAYRFPLQLVLRIYDLIFSEGLSAILKFGIVLMQKNAAALLAISDMAHLTTFLKDRVFDVYIDATPSSNSILENGFFGSSSSSMDKEVYRADQLVRDACEVKITPEMLKAYQVEWEEKTRADKARETELESLRGSNANYAIRVRRLEARIQDVDREQASLATDMVRTKVENDELKDENESLKVQVKELRIVIEKQPVEIEAAWQLERDDLMKRNGNVHEENQKLEKELAELEEQLVLTKMQYAEVSSPPNLPDRLSAQADSELHRSTRNTRRSNANGPTSSVSSNELRYGCSFSRPVDPSSAARTPCRPGSPPRDAHNSLSYFTSAPALTIRVRQRPKPPSNKQPGNGIETREREHHIQAQPPRPTSAF